jgi:hypothetical protein
MSAPHGSSWRLAYDAVQARVAADSGFRELVRCYGGRPSAVVPSPRARRLALRICDRVGLAPNVWLGVVYGTAADAIERWRVAA